MYLYLNLINLIKILSPTYSIVYKICIETQKIDQFTHPKCKNNFITYNSNKNLFLKFASRYLKIDRC